MYETQLGCCAVCKRAQRPPSEMQNVSPGRGTGEWHTDHCHKTGKVRGILCRGCNIAAGGGGDDPEVARRLAAYLELHRAHPYDETV